MILNLSGEIARIMQPFRKDSSLGKGTHETTGPVEQTEKRKLGIREVHLDQETVTRIGQMLTRDDSIASHPGLTKLRPSDKQRLQQLENIWFNVYNDEHGIGYYSNVPMSPLEQALGTEKSAPVPEKMQRALQKRGLKLSFVNAINGRVDTSYTNPHIRLSYRNPFQALRVRSLLRAPKPNQSQNMPRFVQQVA